MSVAIAGDKALIGASGGTGSAYLYERNQGGANNWGEIQKLTAADNPNDTDFGASVAIGGNTLLVGEPGDEDITFSHPGAANIFEPPNLIFEDHFESNPTAR
jgi:hypothetical protein